MRVRPWLCISTMATAAICTASTFAGGSSCCVPNGGVGCDDATCQAAVCAVDNFCCATEWDSICADEAASLCPELCGGGGGGCGTGGDCCSASGGIGCNDVACCEAVCAVDSFCCATAWDGICATEAASLCPELCAGGGTCGTGGDCCSASGGLGCNDVACCEAVCAADSFCCTTAWDGICASEAGFLCLELCGVACDTSCPEGGYVEAEGCGEDTNGGCNAPPISGSNCCTAWGGIGCDDIACQDAVCAADSFCCVTAWDGICAGEAASICGDLCAAASAYEAIACGDTICGTFWADGSFRDTDWYSFSVDSTTEVSWNVNSVIPTTIAILDQNCPPFIFVIETATGCPHTVTWCLDAGNYAAFVAPGIFSGVPCGSGEANNYVASLVCAGSCEPLGCGSDSAGDCCAAQATPFCNDAECCNAVCAADSFCCAVQWDGICANSAASLCAICSFEAPANDDCAGAFAVVNGANAVTSQGATGQTDLPAECDSFGSVSVFNDVWYAYTATATGTVVASTCNAASFDTRLAVFSGSCADPVFVACNDDGDGCTGFTSEVSFNAECGETYFIVLGAFTNGVTGTGTLTITPSGECPSDCVTDLNGDGFTDAADLAILLGNWGGVNVAGDFNGGGVDASDLAILLGGWGPCS